MSHPALWFSHIKIDRRQDTVQNIYYFFPAKQPALTWHTPFQLLATLRPGTGLTAAARAKQRADPNTALGSAAPKAGKLFLFALGGPDRCDSEGTVAKFWRVARQTCSQGQEQQAARAARPAAGCPPVKFRKRQLCGAAQTGDVGTLRHKSLEQGEKKVHTLHVPALPRQGRSFRLS